MTIAVSLSGDDPTRAESAPGPRPTVELLNRMWRSTTALLDTNTARTLLDTPAARSVLDRFTNDGIDTDDHDHDGVPVPRLGSFEVMNRTIDIAQAALMRHTMAAYPPDLLIEVPRSTCRSLEFYRADEVIDIGQELAAAALDALGGAGSNAVGTARRDRASRRPCSRPAWADGIRQAGSSGLRPNATSDASSANTVRVAPGKLRDLGVRTRFRTATASSPPTAPGRRRRRSHAATTMFTVLPTPPSM